MAILKSIVNGEFASTISLNDRGFNYGDGLFETIAMVNNKPVLWEQHFQRLSHGCEVLGISKPDEQELKDEIARLCADFNSNTAYVVKIVVTRGESERGYKEPLNSSPNLVLILSSYPVYKPNYWDEGVSIRLCSTKLSRQTQLAGIKHLNRLEQVLARREWGDEFQEGLMAEESGNIIEGVMTNLFIVKDNVIITPDLSDAGVNGIMRNIIITICEAEGIQINQGIVSLDELNKADEIFLTNSLIGVWPVKNIEDKVYPVGMLTRKLMRLLVEKYLVDYASVNL